MTSLSIRVAVLMVPPSLEINAKVLVQSATVPGSRPLDVVTLAELDGHNYAYLLPRPESAQFLARSYLAGGDPSGMVVEQLDTRRLSSYDGSVFRLRHSFGIDPVSPLAVRTTLS